MVCFASTFLLPRVQTQVVMLAWQVSLPAGASQLVPCTTCREIPPRTLLLSVSQCLCALGAVTETVTELVCGLWVYCRESVRAWRAAQSFRASLVLLPTASVLQVKCTRCWN